MVHLQSNGGTLRRHLTNSYVVEVNRHQNNVNTERLHQQRTVSTQFDGIKANFLRLGSTNVGIVKVGAFKNLSIRGRA